MVENQAGRRPRVLGASRYPRDAVRTIVRSRHDGKMIMSIRQLAATALFAAALAGSGPAGASQVAGGWYTGDWRCTLDGRLTRIVWDVVSVDRGSSDDDVGTSVAGAERRGRFWDWGSWAGLSLGRATSTAVHFKHADGNNWYLRRASAGQATGYSTWQGRRYPLSCTKAR
jgi:Family of unknown function (DUF6006)